MIDTAKYEIAKEQVQGTLGDLSERVLEADVVQQLRKATRRELKHAQHELKKAAKHAQKAAPSRGRSKSRRSRQVFLFFTLAGTVAVLAYVLQRRKSTAPSTADVAPDPFGAAVREEERAGAFERPAATPTA